VVSEVLLEVLYGIFNERFSKIKNVDKNKQESRAAARKPRDAASVLFG